ncbi:MAG: DEAD/DEAH box helicase [Granulosicoccus sp.]
MIQTASIETFAELQLPPPVLQAVQALGYEKPSPIQQRTIPPLLLGNDLLGHAPTGTGKTAAFALPILSRLDPDAKGVQALILTPTRELAIQVAEAICKYAGKMKRVRVLPIYGGQDYTGQIRQLNRGVNIVVGTPGRIMDHMRRGTLSLSALQTLVLDEADEMLRMGFIDDVEWILEQTPAERQSALFSATMPSAIARIAKRHLRDPVEITIEGRISTAATIRQRFWLVSGLHKLDALTRLLEAETFDAMLVFVRTRLATVELAEKLSARGFVAAALNGDMPQKQREQIVDKLRRGKVEILVATDVVARGLDVERISHVINYDIPYDTEAYVHRIGRTGRAGRSGDAILFVTQRERRLLASIEHTTRQKIEKLILPSVEMVNNKRIHDFKQRIRDTMEGGELAYLQRLVEEVARDNNVPAERVGAALAKMCIGEQPLLLEASAAGARKEKRETPGKKQARESTSTIRSDRPERSRSEKSGKKAERSATARVGASEHVDTATLSASENSNPARVSTSEHSNTAMVNAAEKTRSDSRKQIVEESAKTQEQTLSSRDPDLDMERFRIEVGNEHGVKPENIVGAIANEAGLDAQFIGRVSINDQYSLVELPTGMPKFILKDLKRVWVCNRQLNITRVNDAAKAARARAKGEADTHGKASPKKKMRRDKPPVKGNTQTATAERSAKKDDTKHARKKKMRHRDRKSKGKPA